jgi:glycosyltransferase 2 family protein
MLRITVTVGLLAWLAWRMDWPRLTEVFQHLQLGWWLAAVALYFAAQFISALRWQLLSRPLGFGQPLRRYVGYYFIGMYFNLLLPTSVGGDVVRAWYLDSRSGHRLNAFLSVFLDRFSGLLVLLGLACVAALVCPIELPAWVRGSVWGACACTVIGLAALPALRKVRHRSERLQRLLAATRLYFGQPGLLAQTTFLSLIVQAANVVLVWLVGLAIHAPVPASYYWIVVPMVTLLTMLPVSISGMGVREGGMVLFLAPLGVERATAVSIAFLSFCVFLTVSLLGAAVYFVHQSRPEDLADEPVRCDPHQGRARQSKAAA